MHKPLSAHRTLPGAEARYWGCLEDGPRRGRWWKAREDPLKLMVFHHFQNGSPSFSIRKWEYSSFSDPNQLNHRLIGLSHNGLFYYWKCGLNHVFFPFFSHIRIGSVSKWAQLSNIGNILPSGKLRLCELENGHWSIDSYLLVPWLPHETWWDPNLQRGRAAGVVYLASRILELRAESHVGWEVHPSPMAGFMAARVFTTVYFNICGFP